MACYHPLKGFVLGYKDIDSNKKDIKITNYNVDHIEIRLNNINKTYNIESKETFFDDCYKRIDDYIDIPCGKCLGCKMEYRRQWSNRILCELESMPKGSQSWFVTLTYDPDKVPLVDSNFIGVKPVMSLRKKDLQDFMKRLRKAIEPEKCRFYACGEYGSSTMRPHYHLILFNVRLDDLVFYTIKNGHTIYNSPWLERIWKSGFVTVSNVTAQSAGYTAGYVYKKAFGQDNEYYASLGIEPEFNLMSRRPGIGYAWLQKNENKVLDSPHIYHSDDNGSKTFDIPRYFMVKLSEDSTQQNKEKVELIKEQRLFYAKERRAIEDILSSKPYVERLLDDEIIAKKKFRKERDPDGKF